MCGIRDQNYPARIPSFEFHPFHSRANDLLVTFERGQIFLHAPRECGKAVAQPLEASLQRVVEAPLDHMGKTVGTPGPVGKSPKVQPSPRCICSPVRPARRIEATLRRFMAPRSFGAAAVSTVDLIPSAPTTNPLPLAFQRRADSTEWRRSEVTQPNQVRQSTAVRATGSCCAMPTTNGH